jgi:hypothetical protein
MSFPPINCEPVGLGDIANRLGLPDRPSVVRDVFAANDGPTPRGRITRTNWWDWYRDAIPFLRTTRLAERLDGLAGIAAAGATEAPNVDPVGLAEINERFGLAGGNVRTSATWFARGILPEPRGEILGGGTGGSGGGKPVPWWDWRRDVEPWGLTATARTMPEPRLSVFGPVDGSQPCPSCETFGSMRTVGLRDHSTVWASCAACGWTEREGMPR